MTHDTKHAPRGPAMPAAALIGALALAGCSSGHIGESWQCPLAKGGSCESVAAADPAVPKTGGRTVLTVPLWRAPDSAAETPPVPGSASGTGREPGQSPSIRGPAQTGETVCATGCGGWFDPFGWLWRLFADGNGGDDRPDTGQPEPATAAAESDAPPARTARETDPAGSSAAAEDAAARTAERADATVPGGPVPFPADLAQDRPGADDLRTGEVVARIWIAPFVDGSGVYREASHVRVVLEPAGWRLK